MGGKKWGVGSREVRDTKSQQRKKNHMPQRSSEESEDESHFDKYRICNEYLMTSKPLSHTDAFPQPPGRDEGHSKSPERTWGQTSKGRDPRVPPSFPSGIGLRGRKEIQDTTRWQHRARDDAH